MQLSQLMDKLFDMAADRLSFGALLDFTRTLIHASCQEIQDREQNANKSQEKATPGDCEQAKFHNSALLLNRICQLVLRVLTDPKRPMLVQLKLWSVVSDHLMDVACSNLTLNGHRSCHHLELPVRQKALLTLHESIMVLIMSHMELPHFFTNEALCKPFELMIRLELCDSDLQDRLISCICELVEACKSGIHSGWRPLFAALSAVRMDFSFTEYNKNNIAKDIQRRSEEMMASFSLKKGNPNWDEGSLRHLNTVREVFEVFINSHDDQVYSNALIDCALCLLRYLPEASGQSTVLKVRRRRNLRAARLNRLIAMRKQNIGTALSLLEPSKEEECTDDSDLSKGCSMSTLSDSSCNSTAQSSADTKSSTKEATYQLCDLTLEYLSKCVNILLAQMLKSGIDQDSGFKIESIERHIRLCFGDLEPARFRFYGPRTLKEIDSENGYVKLWYLIVHQMARDLPRSPNEKNQSKAIDCILSLIRKAQLIDRDNRLEERRDVVQNLLTLRQFSTSTSMYSERQMEEEDLFFRPPADGVEAADENDESDCFSTRAASEDLDYRSAYEEETPKHALFRPKTVSTSTQESDATSYHDPVLGRVSDVNESFTYNPEDGSGNRQRPGLVFSVFMVNHVLLPSMQFWIKNAFSHSWIRELEPKQGSRESQSRMVTDKKKKNEPPKEECDVEDGLFHDHEKGGDHGSIDVQGSLEESLSWAAVFSEYFGSDTQKNGDSSTLFPQKSFNNVRSRKHNSIHPSIIKIAIGQVTDLVVEIIQKNARKPGEFVI
ncbi:hypothetical protein Ciccas_000753 [Cichlidogyrus casuarinus]|uniref:Mon2/Sec7/BIG1-like HDS domain-containing protein n=1 Tax=Cichlidogyrus casuarinus TaxID=1844966 RepID=A0ABD2QN75_9PLAT